ncbi:MAG: HAD-IIB family hydrolase [Mycoplasma sp.]
MNIEDKKLKYKLFSIDLDGTLLTRRKKITQKDIDALKKYMEAGGEVFINTGKSLNSTMKHVKQIEDGTGIKLNYVSCLSGNTIYDLKAKKVLYSNCIDNETCHKIYKICKRNIMAFMPYIKELDGKRILEYIIYKKYRPMEAYKINVFASIITTWRMSGLLKQLKKIPGIEILTTHKVFYEIVREGSDKGFSLNFIADKLKIKREEIAAIGDSYNDSPSFKHAGASFLVKPHSKLNKMATHVVKIKRNRVSKVINEYF